MPLVTRLANQGVFFKQATQPTDWQNGDIWIDTDDSNGYVNQGGTAVRTALGSLTRGDILYASADDTIQRLAKGTNGQYLKIGANDPAWADLTNTWEILDNHTTTASGTTYTFTPSTALDFDTYSKIIVVIDFSLNATAAVLLRINGSSNANYYYGGVRQSASATTAFGATGQTSASLATATMLNDDHSAVGTVEFYQGLSTGQLERVLWFSDIGRIDPGSMYEKQIGQLEEDNTTITSITVLLSTSSWRAGGHITTYGVKRA